MRVESPKQIVFYSNRERCVSIMDISALSPEFTQQQLMDTVNIKLMRMAMDSMETSGNNMVKSMEASVQPDLGQNIDITI